VGPGGWSDLALRAAQGRQISQRQCLYAADVKFTFERMKDPKYSKLLNIANSIESIETPDDFTVIFKTKKPVPWFAETMHQNFIVDMESS
jgi:peptide/nickel transport system substrate-binding protein